MGRCQAAGCDRVYADVQRGPRRRYCSRVCQNRSSVAALRTRTPRATLVVFTATALLFMSTWFSATAVIP